jgi:hypothetical protein
VKASSGTSLSIRRPGLLACALAGFNQPAPKLAISRRLMAKLKQLSLLLVKMPVVIR